jgi:hypothetical protein
MRGWLSLSLIACAAASAAGCGVRLDGERPNPGDPDAQPGGGDGMPSLGPWGAPARVIGADTTAVEDDGSLSSTGLEMVFAVVDPAANNTKDLWYMSRTSQTATWSSPVKLGFNVTVSDETPRFSPDDLTLYFASARTGGPGGLDIYRVTRTAVGPAATWTAPVLVPGVSTAGVDKWFTPCPGGTTYMTILGNDVGEGTLGNPPTVCAELSSGSTETGTFVSPDCKTIYFASNRTMTNRIYTSTRPAVGMPWSAPVLVETFQGVGGNQEDPWMSTDQRTFMFVSDARGSKDVFVSTR